MSDTFLKINYIKPIIHSVFLMQNSHSKRVVIGWQTGAATFQPIANHPPQDFRIGKTLWINRKNLRERNPRKTHTIFN
jgi:hypothetical protein